MVLKSIRTTERQRQHCTKSTFKSKLRSQQIKITAQRTAAIDDDNDDDGIALDVQTINDNNARRYESKTKRKEQKECIHALKTKQIRLHEFNMKWRCIRSVRSKCSFHVEKESEREE